MSKRRRTQRQRPALQEPTRKPRPSPRAVESRGLLPSGRVLLIGVGVIAAVLFVGAAFANSISATSYTCGEVAAVGSGDPEAQSMPNQKSGHVAPGSKIRYTTCPPTSGPHYAAAGAGPLRQGFYGPDAPAEPGGWVHNLEHGFAVVLYRGEPDAQTLASLRDLAKDPPATASAAACGYAGKVLVARFDDMSAPFAALAWDRRLPLPAWDASAARSFAERSIDATAPEPGGC